jgi:iron(III) transport system substrate-binding protein
MSKEKTGISAWLVAGLLATASALGTTAAQAADTITVYTTVAPEQLPVYEQSFKASNPDISIKWVRDSTGVIAAKLLAEGANAPADVVFSLASENVIQLDKAGLLQPYEPADYQGIDPKFKDNQTPPHWSGVFAYMAAICFNTIEAEKAGLPVPKSWEDLLDPRFKGKIVMPNPSSSGTGYISVSGWLQTMGEEKAWTFMTGLHNNVAMYTHSGSKPCIQAASGEFPVGISFSSEALQLKKRGAPIEVIMPTEGVGWALSSAAIFKSSKQPEAAKKFMDWAVGVEANKVYAGLWEVISRPELKGKAEGLRDAPEKLMINNDFRWAAEHRDQVLKQWQDRFGVKSEPKP